MRLRHLGIVGAMLLTSIAAISCGDPEPARNDAPLRDAMHVRWLHGKGIGTLGTPAPAYYPDGLWAVIQEQFAGQHERGVSPWRMEAFELRPQVEGTCEVELTEHTKGAGPAGQGRRLSRERCTMKAGQRFVLLLATGPASNSPSAVSFRAVLVGLDAVSDGGPGSLTEVAWSMETVLPLAPATAQRGRWHEIGDPGLMVDGLMGFLGGLDKEFQLLAWAPDPDGTRTYTINHGEPQIHGQKVVKGEYEYPLVSVRLRFP